MDGCCQPGFMPIWRTVRQSSTNKSTINLHEHSSARFYPHDVLCSFNWHIPIFCNQVLHWHAMFSVQRQMLDRYPAAWLNRFLQCLQQSRWPCWFSTKIADNDDTDIQSHSRPPRPHGSITSPNINRLRFLAMWFSRLHFQSANYKSKLE